MPASSSGPYPKSVIESVKINNHIGPRMHCWCSYSADATKGCFCWDNNIDCPKVLTECFREAKKFVYICEIEYFAYRGGRKST